MAPESGLELAVGDRVVYPGQGVCKITAITEKVLAGVTLKVVALAREEDGAQVLVPMEKVASVGVRKVATTKDVEPIFGYLKAASDDPELDWKVRHRAHQDKVAMGDLMGLAEVVKSLQILSELRPLPQKERERFDNAKHLLVREVSIALGLPEVDAEDAIDLALIPLGGVKKPRAVKLSDVLAGADADDDLGGLAADLGSIDLGDVPGDEEEEKEEAEEGEEAAGEEAGAEEAGAEEAAEDEEEAPKPKKAPKAKEPKAAKEPKEKKPKAAKEPKAAKAAKEPKEKKAKEPKAAKEPKKAPKAKK